VADDDVTMDEPAPEADTESEKAGDPALDRA
jgi:hypothetical protein